MQEEGGGYSEHDVREMLEAAGLAGRIPYHILSNIHKGMKDILAGCSILDLIHTAKLTHQQMDRGVDLQTAITLSVTDVYIRTQHNVQLRQVWPFLTGNQHYFVYIVCVLMKRYDGFKKSSINTINTEEIHCKTLKISRFVHNMYFKIFYCCARNVKIC